MNENKWFDKLQPLWLPQGSVRALLVISLTIAVVVVVLKSVAFGTDIPQNVSALLDKLLPAIVVLISQYINARNGSKPE